MDASGSPSMHDKEEHGIENRVEPDGDDKKCMVMPLPGELNMFVYYKALRLRQGWEG